MSQKPIQFLKGQSTDLSQEAIQEGNFLFTEDTNELYIDYENSAGTKNRKPIKDKETADKVAQLEERVPTKTTEANKVWKTDANGNPDWYEDENTTYSAATQSANGLMSSTDKTKLDKTNVAYGTCSTSSSTTAKVVTISGNTNWKLVAGSKIVIKFTYTNTASNPTLNVNSTGAKSISFNGSTITTSNLIYAGVSGKYMEFTYDGTYYVFTGMAYTPSYLGFGYGTCSTAASTTAKTASLSNYELTTHGMVSIKFSYAVPASATLNINSKGAKSIYHRGSAIKAGVINAGDIATFIYSGSYYYLISIDKTIDATVTSGSNSLITSGAVYTAINNAVGTVNVILENI